MEDGTLNFLPDASGSASATPPPADCTSASVNPAVARSTTPGGPSASVTNGGNAPTLGNTPSLGNTGPGLADLNPNMEDVMKVIKDLDEDFVAFPHAHDDPQQPGRQVGDSTDGDDNMTSVQDVSRLVDKAALAEDKLGLLNARQEEIEQRFFMLRRRLNLMRCRHLGQFIAEEIGSVRSFYESVVPPAPPTLPKINPFSINVLQPPQNVPDGVVLPSEPSTDVLLQPPTSTFKVKHETREKDTDVVKDDGESSSILSDKSKATECIGQMESHLNHLTQVYDSDATESSSGGESCDELDNFEPTNEYYLPIKRRAKYMWLLQRASIASKWTWLTAQISDLEYRIRQQTGFYHQIRAAKGAVTLGEPVISWPPHAKKAVQSAVRPDEDVPMSCKPATKDYSRMDSSGRKIIIKEPAAITSSSAALGTTPGSTSGPGDRQLELPDVADESTFGASRTRPIKMIRQRRIVRTSHLYKTSLWAAKESSVKCDCIHPNVWCAICYGNDHHTLAPDPVTQDHGQCLALLDHSYHQVLSTKNDRLLHLEMAFKLKNKSWLEEPESSQERRDAKRKMRQKLHKRNGMVQDAEEEEEERKVKSNKKFESYKKLKRDKEGRFMRDKSRKPDGKRRKSISVHHHGDDQDTAMVDLDSDGDWADSMSPIPSPSVPASNQAWADHIRRKRETAFDIDNIVIPYSIAAATRVERPKYKEILTPTWRQLGEDDTVQDNQPSAEETEDIEDSAYELRHAKAELEEKKRWQLPIWKSSGAQRSRSRRQDSCGTEVSSGCNTPDPISPGGVE